MGDIIVVAAGSSVPLVLRPVASSKTSSSSSNLTSTLSSEQHRFTYLLVVSCVLTDAQLRTLGLAEKLSDEHGFSRIMFGSAWDGVFRDGVLKEGGIGGVLACLREFTNEEMGKWSKRRVYICG